MMDLAAGERAIYPSGWRSAGSQLVALALAKLLRGIGLFLLFDLLRLLAPVHLLLAVRVGTSVLLWALQRPLSAAAGPALSRGHAWRLLRHAALAVALDALWLTGLGLCGPLRFILLFEHADVLVLGGAAALAAGTNGPGRTRGTVFFLLAVASLLFLDHDAAAAGSPVMHPEGQHGSAMSHGLYSALAWLGLADHKAGVLLLLAALCLTAGFNHVAKPLGASLGGAKRLHALSTAAGTLLLLPCSAYAYWTQTKSIESPLHQLLALLFVVLVVFVLDYYISALASNKLGALPAARYSSLTLCAVGLLLAVLWNHAASNGTGLEQLPAQPEHRLSGGLLLSFGLVCYAVLLLTGPARLAGSRAANFIGYSAGGLPLYMQGRGQVLQASGQTLLQVTRAGLVHILADRNSRSIFYFLCLNLGFTGVELAYGAWTNSLGLISDGFHMLFDCAALVMGLYAAVLARWKPTRVFTFGYDRVEVLSGFVNGLFLVVIALFVMLSALGRILDPPPINTEKLMIVSVGGLLVNMIGLCAFSHAHTHGGAACSGHTPPAASKPSASAHGHGHSNDTGSAAGHGHSHGHGHGHGHGHSHGHGHGHSHEAAASAESTASSYTNNTNMQGVFLHVMADTLGSVGVIVSSALVSRWGLLVADPLCSLFIAVLIVLSVVPLLRDTLAILALGRPPATAALLKELAQLEGVLRLRDPRFWQHTGAVAAATLHLLVAADASEQRVLAGARQALRRAGYRHITVQVEKDAFHQHVGAMGLSVGGADGAPLLELDRCSFQPKVLVHAL